MATITLPRSPRYWKNIDRYPSGAHEPCVVCGKPIKNLSTAKLLHIVDGGGTVATEDDPSVGQEGDMDYFPVGPECVRYHPELEPFL